MDSKSLSMVLVVLAAGMCFVANAMSIPQGDPSSDLDLGPRDKNELDERATWLDTREVEEDFTEVVFRAIQELVMQNRIYPIVTGKGKAMNNKTKRGRWQGFCFRRTRNGRFLPYICWKGDRK